MLYSRKSANDKRADFRKALASGKLLRMPGAPAPFVAPLIEEIGYEGVYISGAVVANDLGLPDVGLTTLTEVSERASAIARMTNLPTLLDVDTGFGEPLNMARTLQTVEDAGICAIHLEDQMNPKRCGHLDNKSIVSVEAMQLKIRAAVEARRDKNLLIMARTDAKASEGMAQAIDRAKAYVDAGAEAIFPEALHSAKDLEIFRKAIQVPILANMTEFGKTELLDASTLESIGVNIVIYPVTAFRLAMGAVERGLKEIYTKGHQRDLVEVMQKRSRLYELVDYASYGEFDQNVFNFDLKNNADHS